MATKPSTEPQWDTNGTHMTTATSGHKSDGYASNEIPTSDEFNYQLNLLYVWIHWLAAQLDDVVTIPQALATRQPYSSGFITTAAVLNSGGTTNTKVTILGLKKGDKIVAIRARLTDNATGPSHANIAIYSVADGTASSALATSANSSGSGSIQTIAASGLSITVADLTDYVLQITAVDGANNISVFACSVDVQRAAA